MEFEAGPHGFPGEPYDLSLLPKFGKHMRDLSHAGVFPSVWMGVSKS